MILITLFLGTAIALKSDNEPKVFPETKYFPSWKPIYERSIRTLRDRSPYIDEKKNSEESIYADKTNKIDDEVKNVDKTKYKEDKKREVSNRNRIDLQELEVLSKGSPSSNYFLPTGPLVGKPAKTFGEWYPFGDERKAYFYPNERFEQVLASNRLKRDAAGALRIETNHALPIHADVKPVVVSGSSEPVGASGPAETAVTVTEKVTAPEDTIYEVKSLRKSLLPLPNTLEIARSINRIIIVIVALTSAVVEFYPMLDNLFNFVYTYIYQYI